MGMYIRMVYEHDVPLADGGLIPPACAAWKIHTCRPVITRIIISYSWSPMMNPAWYTTMRIELPFQPKSNLVLVLLLFIYANGLLIVFPRIAHNNRNCFDIKSNITLVCRITHNWFNINICLDRYSYFYMTLNLLHIVFNFSLFRLSGSREVWIVWNWVVPSRSSVV